MSDEQRARETIDRLLTLAGWSVQDPTRVNLTASRGIAVREFPLMKGYGFADYLLYVDGRAIGVIEAKKAGTTLTGVEIQTAKYSEGLPQDLPALLRPLPFLYQTTGDETRFTSGLDPEPRSRPVFTFHRPDTLAGWLEECITSVTKIPFPRGGDSSPFPSPLAGEGQGGGENVGTLKYPVYLRSYTTFLARLQQMPPVREAGLWPAQIQAIRNIEQSLKENRPRALIQMATGSGKTFTAINLIYRLIKFAGARRVLFLVDRGNLGDQTLKEFQQYVSPYNNFKFTEEFIVQRLSSNTLDKTARVCISTIQRLYAMLKGQELSEEDDEHSVAGLDQVFKEPEPIEYNPNIPIETFDVIITDECHRSIYNLWRQVLEYFDAYLIGLTATPSKQTFGFFRQNLVMEYNHEQAVADGVNVNYDVYRIRTRITEGGSKIDSGFYVDKRDRETRKVRWEQLSDDFEYDPNQLDRDVVAVDQIRTLIRTFRDKLFTEIFPNRTDVPKTLIFAKDDSHAEDIVQILREEFGKGNDFAQKITYRTTGDTPQNLIKTFRNSYNPRIAVTVDMIATGTDIKPLEIVLFMRAVKSRTFFEQMKGRGVRIINPHDLQQVTPDAPGKDHFVIVDAVGVCEQDKTDSLPMDRKKSVPFDKLLQAIAFGNTDPDVISSVAARLARLERHLSQDDHQRIHTASGGIHIRELTHRLVDSLNPDNLLPSPPKGGEGQGEGAVLIPSTSMGKAQGGGDPALRARLTALKPLHNPDLRNLLIELKRKSEQVIDHVSQDIVLESGFSSDALDRARQTVQSFEQFIQDHKDEITALQILYTIPARRSTKKTERRLTFEQLKELAEAIQRPPHLWNESQLWQAYAALDKSKVKGATARRILTDLVSLVRYAIHQDNELVPFPERVNANFNAWLAQIGRPRESGDPGIRFTPEQLHWLEMIRDHIAANLRIDRDDFDYAPFAQEGGIGKVYQVFGDRLDTIIEELNEVLAA